MVRKTRRRCNGQQQADIEFWQTAHNLPHRPVAERAEPQAPSSEFVQNLVEVSHAVIPSLYVVIRDNQEQQKK